MVPSDVKLLMGRIVKILHRRTQDVNIVRALVMGLIASYGFSDAAKVDTLEQAQPSSRTAGVNGQLSVRSDRRPRLGEGSSVASSSATAAGGQQRRAGPVEALQPFLMEHAERFWHELRCAHIHVYSLPRAFTTVASMLLWHGFSPVTCCSWLNPLSYFSTCHVLRCKAAVVLLSEMSC